MKNYDPTELDYIIIESIGVEAYTSKKYGGKKRYRIVFEQRYKGINRVPDTQWGRSFATEEEAIAHAKAIAL
jgi:hypothetical protein